ncbi:MAG TPA: zinc-ribbon domain-containing protein [Chthoniobacterales bacterium]|jgi:uncharacterized membrane protein YvbJ
MANRKPNQARTPEICPVCGDDVPPRAVACPKCGADHKSGWSEEAQSNDALGLSDDSFDYAAFVEQEFGSSPKPVGMKRIWWVTAIIVTVILAAIYFYTG